MAILAGYAGLSEASTPTTAQSVAAATAAQPPASAGGAVGWAKGRLLVAPRAGLSDRELERVLKSQNARSKGRFKQTNVHVVELPAGADEVAAMRALNKDRRLKYVELDMVLAPAASVNDPAYSKSWALTGIDAPGAWDTANGSGVTIAILDTGVDGSHPDLATNMVPGWNIHDNNADTSDVHGHGTSVSGTAAMAGNNGTGSAGVAWGAKIMPVRISMPDGLAYTSTIAQGINWAADRGARVANISYGVSGSQTVQSSAQYMRSKGGVVVVSAGNSGTLVDTLASDAMLSVAATDSNDIRASWSSYGAYVDLSAPGVSIYAPTRGGGYGSVSGTSFSSPITAATAALMLSANSGLGPADIDAILKMTAVDLGVAGADSYFGSGRIDAAGAVAMARSYAATDSQAPAVSITSPSGGVVSGIVAVDLLYSDNAGVTRAELYVDGRRVALDQAGGGAFVWDTTAYADGIHTLMAKAYDAAGNIGTSSPVSVTLRNDTVSPVIGNINLTDGIVVSPTKQVVSASATDNQGVARMSLSIDGKEVATSNGGSISYSWNTRKVAKGGHSIIVRASDAGGNATSRTVTVYR